MTPEVSFAHGLNFHKLFWVFTIGCFIGVVMLILGMGLFQLGAETAMTPLGEGIGAEISKSRRMGMGLLVGFVMGLIITISEPDLQVLAQQVPSVPNMVLILTAAVGVGLFLALAIARIRYHISLSSLLIVLYVLILGVSFLVPKDFIAVAFDSGGVASGPMTSTFLLPLSIGACQAVGGNIMTDAFGVVALAALTPLIAIQIMGLVYQFKLRKRSNTILICLSTVFLKQHSVIDVLAALPVCVIAYWICCRKKPADTHRTFGDYRKSTSQRRCVRRTVYEKGSDAEHK